MSNNRNANTSYSCHTGHVKSTFENPACALFTKYGCAVPVGVFQIIIDFHSELSASSVPLSALVSLDLRSRSAASHLLIGSFYDCWVVKPTQRVRRSSLNDGHESKRVSLQVTGAHLRFNTIITVNKICEGITAESHV